MRALRRVGHPDPDAVALARRYLAETGLADGALAIARPEALAAIAAARIVGERLASAQFAGVRHCRVCGCTDTTACRDEDPLGRPCGCHWVARDLCSVCARWVGPAA